MLTKLGKKKNENINNKITSYVKIEKVVKIKST